MKTLILFIFLIYFSSLKADIFWRLDHSRLTDGASHDIIRQIKEEKINPNLENKEGESLLYVAARSNLVKVVEYLADQGANVNFQTKHSLYSPLYIASMLNHLPTMEKLLEKKAIVDIQNKWGTAPIHEACENGYPKQIELLIQYGSDLNIKNKIDYRAPVHYLDGSKSEHLKILKLLHKYGAYLGAQDYQHKTIRQILIEKSQKDRLTLNPKVKADFQTLHFRTKNREKMISFLEDLRITDHLSKKADRARIRSGIKSSWSKVGSFFRK